MKDWNKIKKEVLDKCKTDLSKHKEKQTKDNQDYFLKGRKVLNPKDENIGIYYKEYDLLWEKLVPDYGKSETIIGEMIRIVGRLNHEYYNNGNCNLQEEITDDCEYCGGSGYEECTRYECEEGYIMTEDEDGNEVKELCHDCFGDYEQYADCGYCGGDIYINTGKYKITEQWANFLEYIDRFLYKISNTDTSNCINALRNLQNMLENFNCYTFEQNAKYKNVPIGRYYNTFTDELMYIILNTVNNPVNPQYEVAKV